MKKNENITVIRSSPDPTDISTKANAFKTLISDPGNPVQFSCRDVKIQTKTSQNIRLICCPSEDYDDFSELLHAEEGLYPASPIVQIEDFASLMSSCE